MKLGVEDGSWGGKIGEGGCCGVEKNVMLCVGSQNDVSSSALNLFEEFDIRRGCCRLAA